MVARFADPEERHFDCDDGTSGTFTTDALGRSVAQSVNYGSFTKNSSNTYYKNGLTKSSTGPDEISYTYTYDGGGQLRTVDIPGEGKIVYQSYRWTVPTRVVLPGNTVQEYEYDDLLRVTRVHSKDPAGGTVMDQRYTRDLNGRVVRKDTEQGFFEYGYDQAYRLTSVVSDVMPNEAYEYDAAGNRLPADSELQAHWVYNEDNELLSTDIATYTYDEAGNMVSETTGAGERRFYWDERGRLKRIESGDESAIGSYEYDPWGGPHSSTDFGPQ